MKLSSSSAPIFFSLLLLFLFAATSILASGEVIFKDGLKNSIEIKLPSGEGPESFAFDCNGEGPYTGLSDGRILKWQRTHKRWVEFAVTSPNSERKLCDGSRDSNKEPTCGRPLGLKFDKEHVVPVWISGRSFFSNVIYGIRGKFVKGVLSRFAYTCFSNANPNRPYNLYIADAYFGLLMVGPSGGVAKHLAISANNDSSPFKFLNGLHVDDQTGVVYFS